MSIFSKLRGSSTGAMSHVGRLTKGLGSEILWQLTGNPDILLGIIPIFTAQRYEVARSHEKMKYRAVAGQFFAHQRGGNVGFKVVLYLIGKQSLNYLTYIQFLHLMGDASYNKITDSASSAKAGVQGLVNAGAAQGSAKKMFTGKDLSWQIAESHYTFTIVTREEIMHDMYIETVLYERDITMGDALKVTLLCRKYIQPLEIAGIDLLDKDEVILSAAKQKTAITDNGTFSSDVKQVKVAYTQRDTFKINAIGLGEQALHRYYVDNLSDKWTDLEILRSVGGRLNSTIYGLNGKITPKKVGKVITDNIAQLGDNISESWMRVMKPEEFITNSKLSGVEFIINTGQVIIIDNPKNTTLIRAIEKNNVMYDLRITTPNGIYWAKIFVDVNGAHMSKITKSGDDVIVHDINSNAAIVAEDDTFAVLIFKTEDTFEFYRYVKGL